MAKLWLLMTIYEKNMAKRLSAGFSLIELMITVAIIGILTSIAYPNYQASIMKSRRVDAQGKLMSFANAMERYYTQCNTYPTLTFPCPAIISPIDPNPTIYYKLSFTTTIAGTIDGSTYELKALAQGVQTADLYDTLTLDQTGNRQCIKGTVITLNCW